MLIKFTPHSLAIALANIVLPVPGIPYNRTPLCNFIGAFLKISGYLSGHCRISMRDLFVSVKPPISDQECSPLLYNCAPCRDIGIKFFNPALTCSSITTIGNFDFFASDDRCEAIHDTSKTFHAKMQSLQSFVFVVTMMLPRDKFRLLRQINEILRHPALGLVSIVIPIHVSGHAQLVLER